MTPTISQLLKPMKERVAKATPGPWRGIIPGTGTNSSADYEFIAHSRTDMETLLKCVELLCNSIKESKTNSEAFSEVREILEEK